MSSAPTLAMFRDAVLLEYKATRLVWLLGGGLRTVAEPREITKDLLVLCEDLVDKVVTWPRLPAPDGLRPLAEQVVKDLKPIVETNAGGTFNDPQDRRVWISVGALQTAPQDLAARITTRRQLIEQLLEETIDAGSTKNE